MWMEPIGRLQTLWPIKYSYISCQSIIIHFYGIFHNVFVLSCVSVAWMLLILTVHHSSAIMYFFGTTDTLVLLVIAGFDFAICGTLKQWY